MENAPGNLPALSVSNKVNLVGTFVARFQVRFSSQLPDERIEAPLKFAISPENEHSKRMVSLLFVDQSGVLRTTGMLNQMNGMYSLTVTVIHSSRNNTAKVHIEILSTKSCQPKFLEGQSTVLYMNSSVRIVGRYRALSLSVCHDGFDISTGAANIWRDGGSNYVVHSFRSIR